MTVSERYRALFQEVRDLAGGSMETEGEMSGDVRMIRQAAAKLGELADQVGDIPRIRLEVQLTPVLLKAHGSLDRARLILEEEGEEDRAAAVWELEQKIYRLLNEL